MSSIHIDISSIFHITRQTANLSPGAQPRFVRLQTVYHGLHTNATIPGHEKRKSLSSDVESELAAKELAQTVNAFLRGLIQIVHQNFGFDLENGVKTIPITDQEHYYLEVR